MASVLERAPAADGVNVTVMVVLAFGKTVTGSGFWVLAAKSPLFPPVRATLEIARFAVPVFVMVNSFELLGVPTSWLPKSRLVGLALIPGNVPVPDRVIVCGLPVALSEILRVAVREPV